MLRQIVRKFRCALVLQQINATNNNISFARIKMIPQRTLFQTQKPPTTDTDEPHTDIDDKIDPDDFAFNRDTEYIRPYRADRERQMSASQLFSALRTRFRLTAADEKRLLNDEVMQRKYKRNQLIQTLELLCMQGVTKRTFLENPWLLTLDKKRLEQKLLMLQKIPMRDFNHFAPFLRLTVPRMRKIVSNLNREADIVPNGNRIYYISNKLQLDPYIVAKYISKRLFILEMPYDMFEQNLQHMVEYNVSPMNILKDLWAFRYTPKSVRLRLERAKRAKKDKIMPWMVRCPEPILQRSLKLSLDELAVLGDKTSAVEYLAERLGFSVDETKAIMDRHPQCYTVRVTKMKEVLDYLLNEAGFNRHEVAQVPRILCHSLDTTKERLEELKKLDCRPTTLVIVCRSKREYEKFVRAWTKTSFKHSTEGELADTTSKTISDAPPA